MGHVSLFGHGSLAIYSSTMLYLGCVSLCTLSVFMRASKVVSQCMQIFYYLLGLTIGRSSYILEKIQTIFCLGSESSQVFKCLVLMYFPWPLTFRLILKSQTLKNIPQLRSALYKCRWSVLPQGSNVVNIHDDPTQENVIIILI